MVLEVLAGSEVLVSEVLVSVPDMLASAPAVLVFVVSASVVPEPVELESVSTLVLELLSSVVPKVSY